MTHLNYQVLWDDEPQLLQQQPLSVLRGWRPVLREQIWINGVMNWANSDDFEEEMDRCDTGHFGREWDEWFRDAENRNRTSIGGTAVYTWMRRFLEIIRAIEQVEMREINELIAEARQHEEALA